MGPVPMKHFSISVMLLLTLAMPARILALPPSQIDHAKGERDSVRPAARQSDSKPTAAQPNINGSGSTDLEAATREFDKEANLSAVKLAGDEHKTVQREIPPAGDELSNSLGASHPAGIQVRAVPHGTPAEKTSVSPGSSLIAK
ncbi:MAG TPA: hypothetical protein VNE63_24020 [Candidatus Acidoferrales bacterium]|nr:hypothetical protein [Candidatus Acidoferrales bacterium]